ncbi:phospholipid-transporting ATPase ABCA3 [Patella vulgata]|uniref:phospholipid-transporting ATPase ABCA3 n=1 Tax=Patella vulgata TaxID=6465 RepID=UPI0024A7BC65|nr:phospholipid-transporting ATPase ABCA3 [Patella vulgata]
MRRLTQNERLELRPRPTAVGPEPNRPKKMAASKGRQFLLLLWKNYLIQKRKKLLTFIEIAVPAFFAILLIVIRQIVLATDYPDVTTWNHCEIDQMPFGMLPRKLAFCPDNEITNRILQSAKEKLDLQEVIGFGSEEEMVEFLIFSNGTVDNHNLYIGGIVFEDSFKDGGKNFTDSITMKIRLSATSRTSTKKRNPFSGQSSWKTRLNFPVFQRVGPREKNDSCGGDPGYYREGFLSIQQAVSRGIVEVLAVNDNQEDLNDTIISLKRHPYPPYNDDNFVLVIQQQFPLILMLSFIIVALSIVKDVVYEKERKLKVSTFLVSTDCLVLSSNL